LVAVNTARKKGSNPPLAAGARGSGGFRAPLGPPFLDHTFQITLSMAKSILIVEDNDDL
jgi:hypothetical protein